MRCCDIDDCSHQRTGIRLGPKQLSLQCHCDPRCMSTSQCYQPEACPPRKWRASVSNIGLTLEEDPLLHVGMLHNPLSAQTPQELEEVELDPGCDRTHAMASRLGCHSTHSVTVSASSLAAATFQLPRLFPRLICNLDYWKHPLALFFLCTAGF